MAWRFDPRRDLDAEFRRLATEEISKVRADLTSGDGDRGAAIHRARRSFKKLRSLMRLARPCLGGSYRRENQRWRDAGRALAESRDAAVLAQSFDALVEKCGRDEVPAQDVAMLRKAVLSAANGGAAGNGTLVRDIVCELDQAEARLAALRWPKGGKELANGLRRSQARLQQRWQAAKKHPGAVTLHEWRKRAKDVAAQIALFRTVLPDELKARREEANTVADLLGEEHDLAVLKDRLKAVGSDGAAWRSRDRLLKRLNARRKELRRAAFLEGKTFSSLDGTHLAEEITERWRAARDERHDQGE